MLSHFPITLRHNILLLIEFNRFPKLGWSTCVHHATPNISCPLETDDAQLYLYFEATETDHAIFPFVRRRSRWAGWEVDDPGHRAKKRRQKDPSQEARGANNILAASSLTTCVRKQSQIGPRDEPISATLTVKSSHLNECMHACMYIAILFPMLISRFFVATRLRRMGNFHVRLNRYCELNKNYWL